MSRHAATALSALMAAISHSIRRLGMKVLPHIAAPTALTAWLLVAAGSASAAPFAPATPIAGFGDQPALGQISGAALAADGSSVIVGSSDTAGNRRAVAAFGDAMSAPGAARGFGPPSGAYDLGFAANSSGQVALTYSVGHTAYLTTCNRGRCRPTARVGTSALKPESAVAVQPASGRTIVLWRGRTTSGANRLQWRITTNGRLGARHTLGEFGDAPQLATDASGKTVAIWLADRRTRGRGVRTAARRVGEFLRPTRVTSAPAGNLRVVSSDSGQTVAAWLTAPNGINPENPVGTLQVATRTRSTGFGATRALGSGSTLSLAGSPDGHAVLATDSHLGATSVVVSAARRAPGGEFGPLVAVSPAQFVSDAYGATAAVANRGRALVTWASGADPSAPAPAGVFAAFAEPSDAFGVPQLLAMAPTATLPQPTGAAISPSTALVTWTGQQGGQVARSVG
jgi:hypothetical protein